MAIPFRQFAVVTGASSGIGYHLAKEFAKNGFDVIIVSQSDRINEAAASLSSFGGIITPVQANLATSQGVETLYQSIQSEGRPLDAIAINAGIGIGGAFAETSLEDEKGMIDLNCVSVVHLAKRILPDMIARNQGKILFTASVVSDTPAPYQAVYGATKAFVLNFAEGLRAELADTDITVTALMPGATDTDFFRRANLLDTKVGQMKKDDPADVAHDGFKALMSGKDKIVSHSVMSKVQGTMGKLLPDTLNARTTAKISEPGSAKKAS